MQNKKNVLMDQQKRINGTFWMKPPLISGQQFPPSVYSTPKTEVLKKDNDGLSTRKNWIVFPNSTRQK